MCVVAGLIRQHALTWSSFIGDLMEDVQCVTGTAGHIKAIDKHTHTHVGARTYTHAWLRTVLIMNCVEGSKPSLKLLE